VQGRTGVTPFVWWAGRWGLWPLVLAACGAVLLAGWPRRP
jgi:apolipoprotein N-acyltransferase